MRQSASPSADENFWNFYWEMRLQPMENLGKRAAILAVSALIRRLAQQGAPPLRLLEFGCGEGQILGTLLDAHAQVCDVRSSTGVDYNPQSVAVCRHDFPAARWMVGDFTDPSLLSGLGSFEIVILVNALHEVFSDCFSPQIGETDVPLGKQRVRTALAGAVGKLAPGGWLVVFDGLEPPGDPHRHLRIRFRDANIRDDFEKFVQQYRPFRITYRESEDPLCVTLSQRDFTRYITKSIFLRKPLWQTERFESYQYFTEAELRLAIANQGLTISEMRTLTVNDEKWRRMVRIETPGVSFPEEHILILAQKRAER